MEKVVKVRVLWASKFVFKRSILGFNSDLLVEYNIDFSFVYLLVFNGYLLNCIYKWNI